MMERKAYTAFGEIGFSKTGFGETGRHRLSKCRIRQILQFTAQYNSGCNCSLPFSCFLYAERIIKSLTAAT